MPEFHKLKTAIARQFREMSAGDLFRTSVPGDKLWETYLGSFPEGSNPIYRKRPWHDCTCCRQFIRTAGNVVTVVNGALRSVWDVAVGDPAYETVTAALSQLVKSHPIEDVFLHYEGRIGTDKNFQDGPDGVKTWEHFYVGVPNSRVCSKADIPTRLGEQRTLQEVFARALTELTESSVTSVLELISQGSLYRGDEHRATLTTFLEAKRAFNQLAETGCGHFAWSKLNHLPVSVLRVRNTAIGTLLVDLSAGEDLESAVRKFETTVAPANYKRPTALVTKKMIDQARATVAELGLTSALERRYATLTDLKLEHLLFADRSVKRALTGNVFDDLAATAPTTRPRTLDRVEEVGIKKFIEDVLPTTSSLEVLVENRHASQFVSLIAPADPGASPLFKWDNSFSWSYAGDFADSVRERVKRAGGNVVGELCCRLAWSNYDDLDLHLVEPSREEIYYVHKLSRTGGRLDVDMNAGGRVTREPVENIFYTSAASLAEGDYRLFVHQYCKREAADVGFEAELDFKGTVHRFTYPKAVRDGERVTIAKFRFTRAKGLEITESLPTTTPSRRVWNVDTETFHRVNAVLLSPNYWDGRGVGNLHYFFMLEGCQNDGTARGFYNEFLRPELEPHRRVLELVGSKLRTEESVNQLSGLGLSSTKRDHLTVRVTGAVARTLRLTF